MSLRSKKVSRTYGLTLLLFSMTLTACAKNMKCPSYVKKEGGICYFTYYDDLGGYNEDPLKKCPKGC